MYIDFYFTNGNMSNISIMQVKKTHEFILIEQLLYNL